MSRKATESMLCKINRLIGVDESYKAPEKLMEIIQDRERAGYVFSKFVQEFDYDMSYEWFNGYFEEEHADRKNRKQDFTPSSLSRLLSEMQDEKFQYGVIYEPAAGTGSTVIAHWYRETRKHDAPWDYRPENYLYWCEELSDKTIPFLLFNLMIRGMNAIVVHGNALTREAKEVYHCDNLFNNYLCFSELKVFPHTIDGKKFTVDISDSGKFTVNIQDCANFTVNISDCKNYSINRQDCTDINGSRGEQEK